MHIEIKRGQVSGLQPVDDQRGAVECLLGDGKLRLHRDLADKVAHGDEVIVAGRLQNDILLADAVKNLTQHKAAQLDSSNHILALGIALFIGFLCGVQSYHLFTQGSTTVGTAMALASVGGFVGIVLLGQRLVEISKATSRIRMASV
ncbi:hypothetical protein Tel_01640 [Candidatus Tenderia electrophaga]|jgi:hypothetical protein|uniref:Uncharacterized protein n=1 Tax=Candidatus Tenderia electrophaga TaxID=1748243 RepID=A0A0S2T9W1_9GAMM|nr:hypothetical protein Tel_01640 [Candidatus Tenderia electrophaga]